MEVRARNTFLERVYLDDASEHVCSRLRRSASDSVLVDMAAACARQAYAAELESSGGADFFDDDNASATASTAAPEDEDSDEFLDDEVTFSLP
mmetsp:Transcript_99840/g.198075  ORF Transcript_99840/g.198075 Transcript_99840/m.198075 type:complete len:93 (+) Transcript_99840:89-367(+)|eukprot:CAMPEP_0172715574 /NCGR_PEP_ID=MMETSP1074-20121228/67628_1 /TAXON_ID=2916 /ORGANISM="Ceratium fusus, Strain PA161109" /LENGTH=92 /DNA_ID=CAMNT_0013540167 /DNA_START=103 /DNA_END=381 /DNA_ORIENTATION=-